jgi:type I restriction enzyme R subunit
MTTGVDAQTCKLIVLDTFVKSQTELKQIVGRGTRVYESKSIKKYYFTIMDFRGSTAQFRDPGWDGEPVPKKYPKPSRGKKRESKEPTERIIVDGKPVEISGRTVKVYDPSQPSGHQFLGYKEYIGKTVRELSGEMIEDFKNLWINLEDHKKLVKKLEERRITPDRIRELTNLYEADIFDILVNLAYEKPIKSRHQRAYLVMKDKPFFAKYPEKAREVLTILLDHYAEYGYEELEDRSVLELTKFKKFNGTRNILTNIFSNPKEYDKAVQDLIVNIYEK